MSKSGGRFRFRTLTERYSSLLEQAKNKYDLSVERISLAEHRDWRAQQCKDADVSERVQIQAIRQLYLGQNLCESGSSKCPICAVTKANCFCPSLAEIRNKVEQHGIGQVKLLLYMSSKEFSSGWASNSGKFLYHLLGPENCDYFCAGVSSDESRLQDILLQTPEDRRALLYPSSDASPLREWAPLSPLDADSCPLTLVLIDSTWNGSRALLRRISDLVPEMRRVCIQEEDLRDLESYGGSSGYKHAIRMHSGSAEERGSTFGVALKALKILAPRSGSSMDALKHLDQVVSIHMEAYDAMTHNIKATKRKQPAP